MMAPEARRFVTQSPNPWPAVKFSCPDFWLTMKMLFPCSYYYPGNNNASGVPVQVDPSLGAGMMRVFFSPVEATTPGRITPS